MHQDEPSLFTHLNEVRASALPEGGLSTVVFCGKLQVESDLAAALQMHQEIVEEEVNKEQVNVTGMLLGQVSKIRILVVASVRSLTKILLSSFIGK
jgi:hypothetical protein